ncbi:MAG: hypothetical protein KDD70_01990 [Bdellovibrionales bacterium]|nr:hypothetical protein [Bdellovibrionales bacterium]
MRVRWILALTLMICFVSTNFVSAETSDYPRSDRPAMNTEIIRTRIYLNRMAELAEMAAQGGWSSPQLSALANEFHALKEEINRFTSITINLLSARSNNFRAERFSTSGLGLANTELSIDATTVGQKLNRIVLDEVNTAISNLVVEAASLWRRIAISGTPNTGNCAGGYDSGDAGAVRRALNQAVQILLDSYNLLQGPANGTMSLFERSVVNAQFDYNKEELELLGERNFANLSTQTQHFLRTVIDPIYLDINDKGVTAPTVQQAQAQANEAIAAIAGAYTVLSVCAG